ncbi:MAG: hypothetical protein ACKO9B_07800, partial [Planctomycetota bacterium]
RASALASTRSQSVTGRCEGDGGGAPRVPGGRACRIIAGPDSQSARLVDPDSMENDGMKVETRP